MTRATKQTLTNDIALPVPRNVTEAPSFVRQRDSMDSRLDWWHVETANTDYYHIHHARGRALAWDAIRYMRAKGAPHVLRCVVEAMLSRPLSQGEVSVAAGFMDEIGRALCNGPLLLLPQ